MMTQLHTQIKAARRVSTPILAIHTPDAGATVAGVVEVVNGKSPVLVWDVMQGFRTVGEAGVDALANLTPDGADPDMFQGPAGLSDGLDLAIKAGTSLPEKTIVFIKNAHNYVRDPAVAQAIWNVRDPFKADGRTLVLLGPDIELPPELATDVVVLDEPLPDEDQLRAILVSIYEAFQTSSPGITVPDDVGLEVDALRGLAAFPAEQVAAMSMTKEGMDRDALWTRKRQMIEETPGLSVWKGGETFDGIGGVENIKSFLAKVTTGKRAPKAIVFIDEIEKALAGAGGGEGPGDSSGTSQDQLGQLLTYMQDAEATGTIFVGPPGSAKSMVAKAAGNYAGIPTISLDLGGMKGSLVGQSEQNLRRALKVISAISADSALFIATSNKLANLPPELRRRFTFGTYFFDLPDEDERSVIWDLYTMRYGLPSLGFLPGSRMSEEPPDDEGWTGAEIRQACDLADRLGCSLKEASSFIVPVAISAKEAIDGLRTQAHGRFISASKPGTYRKPQTAEPVKAARRVVVAE